MTQPLLDWLPPSVTQHVALALVHFLWEGTAVAIVLAGILRLLRDRAPSDKTGAARRSSPGPTTTRADARYVIACLGLGVMAALPLVNLLVMDGPASPIAPPSETTGGEWLDASAVHRPDPRARSTFDRPPTIVVQPAIEAPLADEGGTIAAAARAELTPAETVGPSGPPHVASPWTGSAGHLALGGFFWIWLAGVSLLSAWHVIGWALSQRLRRGGKTAPDEILALAGRIARRLGIRRAVAVRQTLRRSAPVVIGWIKPALLLPAAVLTGLPPHELEAVLAHELAHVRRHDYLVNLVQAVIETLLFYHPAVWWVSRQIRSEREFCADDLAMRACPGREVYVRSLIAVAESSRWSASPAVAATGGSLLARVRRILHVGEEPSASPRWAQCSALAGMLAALCLGVALIAAAQNRPADGTSAGGGQRRSLASDASTTSLTRLRFLAHSQQDVEKIEEVRRPETELETRLFEARKPDGVMDHDQPAEPADVGARIDERQQSPAPAGQPRHSGELPEHVSSVVRWLPADTELLIVARDFELPYPNPRENMFLPIRAARTLAVEPLPAPAHYGLSGRRVRWAIHGGRNCEIVSAFGSVRQEGASIIHFEEELPEAKLRELRDWVRGAAESVRTVAGHDVYAFPPDRDAMEPSFELKPWQGKYVVLASAEMIITASSDAYLNELLTRMAAPPREVALPVSLPEWKYLDPDADVWLLRHLPSQNPNPRLRVSEGKQKLRGLVWMLRGEKKIAFRATYLPMPNHQKEVEDLARKPWILPGETEIPAELASLLELTRAPDGSVTLAIPGGAGAPAEFEPQRFLVEKIEPSDARMRLFSFFGFGLHASQGLWE